jgi:hypothetical protein
MKKSGTGFPTPDRIIANFFFYVNGLFDYRPVVLCCGQLHFLARIVDVFEFTPITTIDLCVFRTPFATRPCHTDNDWHNEYSKQDCQCGHDTHSLCVVCYIHTLYSNACQVIFASKIQNEPIHDCQF